MRNQPLELRSRRDGPRPLGKAVLIVTLVLPLVAVALRVGHVQATLTDAYADPWRKTTRVERPVIARHGRIVTADGLVLARDETVFQLEVHYRSVESPPNERWLKGEVRRRLTPEQRDDPEQVEAMKQVVLQEREAAWTELARIVPDVAERRATIQRRVERIREAVEKKWAARDSQRTATFSSTSWWQRIWQEITSPPRRTSHDPLVLAEEVDYHSLGDVSESATRLVVDRPTLFRGFRVTTTTRRDYPEGALATHVIGFRGRSVDELSSEHAAARGLSGHATVGRAGIEQAYDRVLRGVNGVQTTERRRDGFELDTTVTRDTRHGHDVTLTIDSRLQATAEFALDDAIAGTPSATGGAAIVMDVRTGALLATASSPRLPPTVYTSGNVMTWNAARDDPRRPLFPRATQMALPPGSVFKLVTALATLESGWDAEQEVFCQGYFAKPDRERCAIFRNYGYGHDRLTLADALGVSCNVFFFELAGAVGPERLRDWAMRCGFGWETGVDVPQEASGRVPGPDGFPYAGSTRQFAIGQGRLTTTPLQVARLTAAIANDGWLVEPRFVVDSEPTVEHLPVTPQTLQTIRDGMTLAVHSSVGTARSLADLPVRMAGKTGSAEVGGGRSSHAWFTGYFPAESPRYVVVVAVEHGGGGGKTAAPVAGAIVQQAVLIDPALTNP